MSTLTQPPQNFNLTNTNKVTPGWSRWFLSVYNNIVNPDSVKIRAYAGSNVAIAGTGTQSKVSFNTETYDPAKRYDNATYKATPGTSGYYHINVSVLWSTSAANYTCTLSIYVNGSEVSRNTKRQTFVAGLFTQELQDTIVLTATDYVEIFAGQDSGGSLNINSGSINSFFTLTRAL